MVIVYTLEKGAALHIVNVCNGSGNNYTGFPIIYRITVVSHIPIYRMLLLMKPNTRVRLAFYTYYVHAFGARCRTTVCLTSGKSRVTRSSRFVILNLTFAAKGHHSSLWPNATTFAKSQNQDKIVTFS